MTQASLSQMLEMKALLEQSQRDYRTMLDALIEGLSDVAVVMKDGTEAERLTTAEGLGDLVLSLRALREKVTERQENNERFVRKMKELGWKEP